jgi:hypothetical protein
VTAVPRRREHLPIRPIWLCRACGHPWPCGVARLTLLYEYAGSSTALHIYLASALGEAVRDLYALNPNDAPSPADIYDRFLSWAAPARREPP